MLVPTTATCPCGGPELSTCCGPYLAGDAVPPTAEALMRSRYTAYTCGNEVYLRATWHPDTVPAAPLIDSKEPVRWLGLEVKSALRLRQRKAGQGKAEAGPIDGAQTPDADTVEFVARYKVAGRAHRLHEISRFVRVSEGGVARWYYLDGSFPE